LKDAKFLPQHSNEKPPFSLLVDSRIFLSTEICEKPKRSTYLIDSLNQDYKLNSIAIDFFLFQQAFTKNLHFLLNKILPSLVQTRYEIIKNNLLSPLGSLYDEHLLFTKTLKTLFKGNFNNLFSCFVSAISSSNLLNFHEIYNIKLLPIESYVCSFSCEFSKNYYSDLQGSSLIQLFQSTFSWQNQIFQFYQNSKALNLDTTISSGLNYFAKRSMELSQSIDSIPVLQQISNLFKYHSRDIAIPGRRFLKRGDCFF
jgi:hypothetical protein